MSAEALKCLQAGCLKTAVDGFKCEQHSTLAPIVGDIGEQIDALGKRALEIIGELQTERGILRDSLRLVLPLAKGYAAAHRVGSNQAICDIAEAALEGRLK